MNSKSFETRRLASRNRPRRIVFNNDGCDVFTLPADRPATPENFLAQRTLPLAGTQVDTIVYTTISSGFGLFTHDTRVGEVLAKPHPGLGRNIAPELIAQGRDCLRIMVDFGHENGMEVFWSMRMNDTHDRGHRTNKPYFLFPQLKAEHPEYLMGTPKNEPCHGGWSKMNYGRPEVRELAFRFVEEVCRNYEIDGVELDFFRHPVFFPTTAAGEPSTDAEREAMTDLLRRMAALCREEGQRRNRPLLLGVRTPDSLDYCRAIGLDLEQWMREGLIDIHIPSGYFQLNPWTYSVDKARTQGVKVWAGLSESRVGGGHHRHPGRAGDACYRARALNAWEAGVDGIYLFNLFDPRRAVWRELGDPARLESLERQYFVSYRGRKQAANGNLPYDAYFNLPDLNPDQPVRLAPGVPYRTTLTLSGRDLETAPHTCLRIETDPVPRSPASLRVVWNDREMGPGRNASDALLWDPAGAVPRRGENRLEITSRVRDTPIRLLDVRMDVMK